MLETSQSLSVSQYQWSLVLHKQALPKQSHLHPCKGSTTSQVRGIAKVTTGVGKGNLKQKLTVEATGEILKSRYPRLFQRVIFLTEIR
jgi:hypothetical protein